MDRVFVSSVAGRRRLCFVWQDGGYLRWHDQANFRVFDEPLGCCCFVRLGFFAEVFVSILQFQANGESAQPYAHCSSFGGQKHSSLPVVLRIVFWNCHFIALVRCNADWIVARLWGYWHTQIPIPTTFCIGTGQCCFV